MAKKNKKNKNASSNNVNIVLPESLSADEMKNIFVEAMLEVEKRKSKVEEEKAAKELKEWQDSIGVKFYPKEKKIRFRWFKRTWNDIVVFFKMCFVSKDKIKGDRATTGLLKFFLGLIFELVKAALVLCSIALATFIPLQYLIDGITPLKVQENIFIGGFAILIFMLSRLFRIAGFEIEKIDDKNYLFGVLASITSIISIVVAIIAIFQQ